MIYGPPLHEVNAKKGVQGLNTSLMKILSGLTGADPAFAPKVATPALPAWVDFRNVAKAHVNALTLPKGTSERFLLCGGIDNFEDGLVDLRVKGSQSLGVEGAKIDRSKFFSLDRSKAEEVLGIQFIPFQKTVEDVWDGMKELKFL